MGNLFEKLVKFIKTENEPIYDLSVYENGKIQTETFVKGNYCQNSYSVAKVFTTTAVGYLVDEGKLSTDTKLCDIFKEEFETASDNESFDVRWNDVTVDMCLKHRIGLPGGFLDIDVFDASGFGDDYLQYILKTKLLYAPGEDYTYTDAGFYILSRVVSKLSGKNMTLFLWEKLFLKLSYREVSFSQCPKGYAMGATGLYIGSPDMVKLGVAYAFDGKWKGEQVIPESWVKTVFEREYELANSRNGWYFKGGMNGQLLATNPEKKIAVAFHGYEADIDKILNYIIKKAGN